MLYMNSLVIYSVLLILCSFVSHLCLSVLTLLHIAIYSVLDEFHIQSDLRGYWIGECICVYICIYVCVHNKDNPKMQYLGKEQVLISVNSDRDF
jgi:hypothetical protein